MLRLTAATLIVIIIAIQLSTTECKNNKGNKGKKKVCKFNGKTYKPDETVLTDESKCMSLICRKGKSKGKDKNKNKDKYEEMQRKKGGGGGKGKDKGKSSIVAEPIEDCTPTQCIGMPCSGGRCLPPSGGDGGGGGGGCGAGDGGGDGEGCSGADQDQKEVDGDEDKCEDENLACPSEWTCTEEKYTDPDTGCTKCRCNLEDPQYESVCGPVIAPCPMDCGVMTIVEEKTGCTRCICDPEDSSNPFEPLAGMTPKPPSVAVQDGRPSSVSWNDGCNDCACMKGKPVCTEKACIPDDISEDSAICKTGCSKEMMEVCGSDGITYLNACLLDFAKLCRGKNVQFNYTGACECEPCNKRKYDPVCGEDCKTYSSACVLAFQNCKNKKDIKQVKKGSCEGDKMRKLRPKREIQQRKEKKVPFMISNRVMQRNDQEKVVFLGPKIERKRESEIQRRKDERGGISGNIRKVQPMKKGKKDKKCEYNKKKIAADSAVDLEIYCLQLKCIKEGKKPSLEIQIKSECECDMD